MVGQVSFVNNSEIEILKNLRRLKITKDVFYARKF